MKWVPSGIARAFSVIIVYYACIFLFDFTGCHAICLLVLVNSDAHIGPGVIINLEILKSCYQHMENDYGKASA